MVTVVVRRAFVKGVLLVHRCVYQSTSIIQKDILVIMIVSVLA